MAAIDRAFERMVGRQAEDGSEHTQDHWCSEPDCPAFKKEATITGILSPQGIWEWECPTCGSTYSSDLNCDTCKHAPCVCPD